MDVILSKDLTEDERYENFFLHWALKEAFIKAIGLGLGYDLQNIEFTLLPEESPESTTECFVRKKLKGKATVKIQNIFRSDWR